MSKYIQDSIRNNTRCITSALSRPQAKVINEMIRGLLVKQTPILRHLVQNDEIGSKRQAEKYSNHLNHVEIQQQVSSFVWKQILPTIQEDSIIGYDMTDISKEHSEKMEGLHIVRDGSEKTFCNGYELHGIGINNQLAYFGIHPHETETIPSERKKLIKECSEMTNKRGIWVLDRGNDSKDFFNDLHQELKVRFVCRIRMNRYVVMKETGALESISNLQPGRYFVQFKNNHNNKVLPTVFLLIISKHLEDKEPIRLITNLDGEKYADQKIVSMYLERWGVENLFRRIKQKFNVEKIRVKSFHTFKNILSLIHFVMVLSTKLFSKIQQNTTTLIAGSLLYYKAFIKLKSLAFSVDSFLTYLANSLKPLISKTYQPVNQLQLFTKDMLEKLGPI